MSHFTVMVIGEDVDGQLAPYHEFECTGRDDKYVQDIDITAECRASYAEADERRFRDPDGMLHDPYTDRFKVMEKDPIFPSLPRETYVCPAGWEDVRVPTSKSFAEWLEEPVIPHGGTVNTGDKKHKYGYAIADANGEIVKVIDRTNPNKEWDWYVIGGRWSGKLKLKPGRKGTVGKDGTMGAHFAKGDDRADSALKRDIDFMGMRQQAGDKAGEEWDIVHAVVKGRAWDSWKMVRERHAGNIDAARDEYHAQQVVKDLRTTKSTRDFWEIDEFRATRDEHVAAAKDRALSTYAIVKDGQWFAKGEMGGWGCSDDKVGQAEWNKRTAEMLAALPDDVRITIVDCHT